MRYANIEAEYNPIKPGPTVRASFQGSYWFRWHGMPGPLLIWLVGGKNKTCEPTKMPIFDVFFSLFVTVPYCHKGDITTPWRHEFHHNMSTPKSYTGFSEMH